MQRDRAEQDDERGRAGEQAGGHADPEQPAASVAVLVMVVMVVVVVVVTVGVLPPVP